MIRFRVAAIITLLAFTLLPVVASFAQIGTPPPTATPTPTPTPSSLCPPDLQETCDWIGGLVSEFGLWGILLIVLAGVLYWAFQRIKKRVDEEADEALKQAFVRAKTADELSDVTRQYLEKAMEDYSRFNFRGLEQIARGAKVPEFDRAYISLKLSPESDRRGEAASRMRKGASGAAVLDPASGEVAGLHSAEAVDLAGAIKRNSKLAIVGVAGSGKSTLLQWAGLMTARRQIAPEALSTEGRAFVEASGDKPLVPILFALRDFNFYCKQRSRARTPAALVEFMGERFKEDHPSVTLPANFFAEQLKQGCLLMLDGVDEVDPDDRVYVRQAVESLVQEFGIERNRYLVSSRTVAYDKTPVADFARCDVQFLDRAERDALIEYWCKSAYLPDEAEAQMADLIHSIDTSDSRVRDLARTPLMVSIFAVVHYGNKRLPRQRAEFYEIAAKMLLTEPHKKGEAISAREWNKATSETRLDRLARVAYELHSLNQDSLTKDELARRIWPEMEIEDEEQAVKAARVFIQLAADHSGLFEEEAGQFGFFTHRTFREFLAGRFVATQRKDDWSVELAERAPDDQWHEAIQLAAGFLAFTVKPDADKFIHKLMGLKGSPKIYAEALTLAARSMADFAEDRVVPKTKDTLVAEALKLTTHPDHFVKEAQYRRPLGLALSALGDPRFAASLWELPADQLLGEHGRFVPVPAGKFRMGTSPDDVEKLKAQGVDITSDSWNDEKIPHDVELPLYYLSRFPVTNAEYRRFVNDPDYGNPDYWPGEAGVWLNGELDLEKYVQMWPKDYRENLRNWLKGRPPEKRKQPFFSDDPQWNADNLPVVGVTWYEARAYCLWLTARLRAAKLIAEGQSVHLPTEAQWEKAARASTVGQVGNLSYLWPWGDTWDADKCNSEESKFGGTSPVGMYPNGANALGIHDLVGNAWEWTSTVWGTKAESPDFPYPYQAGDGRENPDAVALRAVRGGSWYNGRDGCRAAVRDGSGPADFDDVIGFRAALSP